MPIQKLVSTPEEAYRKIRIRLVDDLDPVWNLINHTEDYSPYWLLARELFPIAESIGDLIYRSKSDENLSKVIDNDFSKVRGLYKDKGKIIALLYRHSLIHQDEPRSIYSGNITIEWEIAYIDGQKHLLTLGKYPRKHVCRMSFDLRAFYEDTIALLKLYEKTGPRRGIVKRYNSWTFKKYDNAEIKRQVKQFYDQN